MEINKGRFENRFIRTESVSPEEVGFPFASQVARLVRQTEGRKDEEVSLVTSAPLSLLPARLWLTLNRAGWDIESGLHQRLDVSRNDDRSRVKGSDAMLVLGMYRRIANSFFMEWRSHQRKPEHVTTTDFQMLMNENHQAAAIRLVLNKRPSLKFLS
jgi:hypothetical protein